MKLFPKQRPLPNNADIFKATSRAGKRFELRGGVPRLQRPASDAALRHHGARAPIHIMGPNGPFYVSIPIHSSAWLARALSGQPYDAHLDWPKLSWSLLSGRPIPVSALTPVIERKKLSFGPVFGAVVHPFLRVASYYVTHVRDGLSGDNHFNYHLARRIRQFSLRTDFTVEHPSKLSFSEFVNFACTRPADAADMVLRPFHQLLWIDYGFPVKIIRMESFYDDLRQAAKLPESPLDTYKDLDLRKALGLEGIDLGELYTDRDTDVVLNFYRADFMSFYFRPKPSDLVF